MEYRQLGASDVALSAITLGGDRTAEDLAVALECGVTSFDTAAVYDFGRSELALGRAIAGRRDKVRVLTKYGLRWDCEDGLYWLTSTGADGRECKVYKNSRPESIIHECEQSLRRLRTDYIDLYQCHWRDPTTPVAETMGAIDKLLRQGKILAAGVSNWTVEEIDEARQCVPLATDQLRYSMVSRQADAELLPYCLDAGIGTIVYTPLEKGLLSGTATPDRQYTDGRKDDPLFAVANRQRVQGFFDVVIRPIADAHDATCPQVVLNWTIHRPGISAALAGARTTEQIRENAGAASFALADDETRRIDDALAKLEIDR